MHRNAFVLVVETDDLIRLLVERWLLDEGYRVEVCGLQDIAVRPPTPRPDLVIVDVPDPRAAEPLMCSLRGLCPAPVLAVSARLQRGPGRAEEAARRIGVSKVLPKPFTRESLLTAVADVLRQPSGA